jgi:CO/xanthine dehydrogenase Mo-binding subunit
MSHRVIGTSPARPDAWEKVRGRPIYAGDLALSGMLYGRIVRSPYASARIVRIDTSAARALPGVIAVLTAEDVPRNEMRMELPGRMAEATAGAVLATQPVLAADRVRFQGEPVVAIAAATPEIAAAAAELVEIDYDELPGVYDPIAALAPEAPKVHDSGNLLRSWHLRSGDIAQGFARADVVVENTYRTPFVDHVYLETESGIGWIDGEGVLGDAREHAGARALPRRRRGASASARARAARGRVPGRRIRRQGRRDRRVPAGACSCGRPAAPCSSCSRAKSRSSGTASAIRT